MYLTYDAYWKTMTQYVCIILLNNMFENNLKPLTIPCESIGIYYIALLLLLFIIII